MNIEKWETRYGKSVRVVIRERGRFVNNKSARQVFKIATDNLDVKVDVVFK